MTLSDVQTHLHALINSSTILLGRSLESDLHALQLSYLRCIGTAILFYHPRGRPLKSGLTWLAREWLGRIYRIMGVAAQSRGLMFGGFWADYEPIMARIAQSRIKWARTVIIYPGSPGAWHGTSATAPAVIVACANNAEVLDRLLGALSRHELILGRLMGLADALGLARIFLAQKMQNEKTGPAQRRRRRKAQKRRRRRDCNAAMTNLNANLTALHLALSLCTAPLIFSGNSDLRNVHARHTPGAVSNLLESAAREPK
ncbi:hypothetical protein EDB92DRAFT_2108477 [Lactarius akahatsu]|uniref:Uncharacterized protein n=1 Tax=Lactarius akahatsu TaxID=416441 RepID=A0AAD4L9S3_9AGAM|nr:hypothetical protein EDB92DRAFT_2108477 [Lactarius akahatsu]